MAEQFLDIGGLVPGLDDRDPQTMFEEWLSRVQVEIPDYAPTNGSLDVIIAEALMTSIADMIYAANRLPGVVLQAVLALLDVPRSPGVAAHGRVEVLLDGPRSVTVPRGTRVVIENLEYITTAPAGAVGDKITLDVEAIDAGVSGNYTPPGTPVDLLDPVPGAVAAQTVGVFGGGADPESDTAYLQRASTWLQRLTSALVLPGSFSAYVDGQPDVGRSYAADRRQPGSDVDAPGHMTVYVLGLGGTTLDAARLTALTDDLQSRSSGHLTVHVANAAIVDVPVAVQVHPNAGTTDAAAIAAVKSAIEAEISPDAWAWATPVVPQEVTAIAARVPGVDYVVATTAPAAQVDMPAGSLPRATATVTVG